MAIRDPSASGAILPVGGPPGLPGQSAYAQWLALGNVGQPADFIASLKGVPGGVTTLDGQVGALSLDQLGVQRKAGDAKGLILTDTSSGAIARSLLARVMMQPVDAMAFGVVADGVTDDAPALNAAIAAASTRLNRTVRVPAAIMAIGQTIAAADWSNVQLICDGCGSGAGSGTNAQDGAVFRWVGTAGGTMIDWRSPSAARPYLTSSSTILGITLDGNGIAAIGLFIRGLYGCRIGLKVRRVTYRAVDVDVYLGGGADVQQNRSDYLNIDLGFPESVNADGVVFGPGSSYNDIHHNTWMNWTCIHQAGTGFKIGNADTDRFIGLQAQYPVDGSGVRTGLGLDLLASPNAIGPGLVTQAARSLSFFHVSVPSGMRVRAGAYGLPSYGCMVYDYVQESGEPDPVVETGATLEWRSTRGEWHVIKVYPRQQIWKSPGDFMVALFTAAGSLVGYLGLDGIFSTLASGKLRIRCDTGGGFGAGNSPCLEWDANNRISTQGFGSFASDAAAKSAGLVVGNWYFNTTGKYVTIVQS